MAFRLPAIGTTLGKHPDLGLLALRLGAGLLLALGHGWPKLATFSEKCATFSDPLGFSPVISLSLAIFAELFCALAVAAGFLTRMATLPVLITMGVAAVLVHGGDGFKVMEKALLFGLLYFVILLAGPGKYSLDAWFSRRSRPG
jgi:putative oxidoreductase